jgi:hypothetical protein
VFCSLALRSSSNSRSGDLPRFFNLAAGRTERMREGGIVATKETGVNPKEPSSSSNYPIASLSGKYIDKQVVK